MYCYTDPDSPPPPPPRFFLQGRKLLDNTWLCSRLFPLNFLKVSASLEIISSATLLIRLHAVFSSCICIVQAEIIDCMLPYSINAKPWMVNARGKSSRDSRSHRASLYLMNIQGSIQACMYKGMCDPVCITA